MSRTRSRSRGRTGPVLTSAPPSMFEGAADMSVDSGWTADEMPAVPSHKPRSRSKTKTTSASRGRSRSRSRSKGASSRKLAAPSEGEVFGDEAGMSEAKGPFDFDSSRGRVPIDKLQQMLLTAINTRRAILAGHEHPDHRPLAKLIVGHLYNNLSAEDKAQKVKVPRWGGLKTKAPVTTCTVCFSGFDEEEGSARMRMVHCKHDVVCANCMLLYLTNRISSADVMPWIPCAHESCKVPLHAEDLAHPSLSTDLLLAFTELHLQRSLARHDDWVACANEAAKCRYGFVVRESSGPQELKCGACGLAQSVQRRAPVVDDGFSALMKAGVLRPCPACTHPATKDYGMCNLIECDKCGIWWNWRSRETASNSRTLKERARNTGTLWEPGELQYSLNLERTNLPAFKALLAKNGTKYDPHFVRGAD